MLFIVPGVIKNAYQCSGKEFEIHVAEWFRHGKQRLQREIEKTEANYLTIIYRIAIFTKLKLHR